MDRNTTKTSSAVCSSCSGRIKFTTHDELAICPYCGTQHAVSVLLGESDSVSIEKIKTRANSELEAERLKLQAERQAHEIQLERETAEFNREKQFKKGKLRFLLFPLMFFAGFLCYESFASKKYLAALVALLMLALFVLSYLISARIIKTRRKGLSALPAILAVLLLIPFQGISNNSPDLKDARSIDWTEIKLNSLLPAPVSNLAEIITNTNDDLWVEIYKTSEKQYASYVEAAKEYGFSLEGKEDSLAYTAYNAQGYKLRIAHSKRNQSMSLNVDAPEQMGELVWPSNPLAQLIPVPSSTTGLVSRNETDILHIKVALTSPDSFNKYVDSCILQGFNQDFSRSENRYTASNSDAYKLEVSYSGFQKMSIFVSSPKKEAATPEASEAPQTQATEAVPASEPTEQNTLYQADAKAPENQPEAGSTEAGNLTTFKESMDQYEAFIDEYIAFMKKYQDSDNAIGMLIDYTKYLKRYAEFEKMVREIDEKSLTRDEKAYFLEVQKRVTQKLLQVAE